MDFMVSQAPPPPTTCAEPRGEYLLLNNIFFFFLSFFAGGLAKALQVGSHKVFSLLFGGAKRELTGPPRL